MFFPCNEAFMPHCMLVQFNRRPVKYPPHRCPFSVHSATGKQGSLDTVNYYSESVSNLQEIKDLFFGIYSRIVTAISQ